MYFPFLNGKYEVIPGLFPLSKDFGNGPIDQQWFQGGSDAPRFLDQKKWNRNIDSIERYVCFAEGADRTAIESLAQRMCTQFASEGGASLPENENTWDWIGSHVAEDFAVWQWLPESESERIEALHLNSPNHWSAQDKIGKSFGQVHAPVPRIETITPWALPILKGILRGEPKVRFVWGLATDDRPNHHPVPHGSVSNDEWLGRRFDPANPRLWVRVERQALIGFPDLNRVLFLIRTYFHPVDQLKVQNPLAVPALVQAILSMDANALIYKGLAHDRDPILTYLQSP